MIHPSAIINQPVIIGKNVDIMENVVIGTNPVAYEGTIGVNRVIPLKGVELGDNVVIHAGAQVVKGLTRDTIISENCVLGQQVLIGHDCFLGRGVRLMVRCTLSGYVEVGEGSMICAGVVVRERVKIGKGCVIGMGSTVTHDIPDNTMAYNVTKNNEAVRCRPIKTVRGGFKQWIRNMLV